MQILDLLHKLPLEEISDIYIQSNQVFYYKISGQIHQGQVFINQEMVLNFMTQNLPAQKQNDLFAGIEQNISLYYKENYYRLHFFLSQNLPAINIRVLPKIIKNQNLLSKLPILKESINQNQNGLLLIAGSTGSGKTTSANAILNFINQEKVLHIVCIEDPIEYRHSNQKSIFTYREVGIDTQSFHSGILSALRQDPNIIFVGELRQKEAIESALLASQTGHFVIATLHGGTFTNAILRFLSVFKDKASAASEMADSLIGILLQTKNHQKFEVSYLPATSAIKNLIKEQKFSQIHSQANLILKNQSLQG